MDREVYTLLAYDLQHKKVYKVANRVLYLIEKFGLETLISIFAHSFEIFCGNVQTNVRLKDVREIMEFAVMKHVGDIGFYAVVSRFFDMLIEFPVETFGSLTYYITFHMVVGALESRHGKKALEYLKEKLLPDAARYQVRLPKTYSVLLPTMGVGLDVVPSSLFDAETKFEENIAVTESDEGVYVVSPEAAQWECVVDVSVEEVISDYDDEQLFDVGFIELFLKNFPSISFASYLVHLMLDKRQLSSRITKGFISKFVGKDCTSFIKGLDIPETARLSRADVALVFDVIRDVYMPNLIELKCFLGNWSHHEAKFQFLEYIAKHEHMFRNAKYHTCWGSSRFMKGVVTYSGMSVSLGLFAKYATQYPDVSLLSLFKVQNKTSTKLPLFSTLCDCLRDKFFLICRNSELLRDLWQTNPKAMRKFCYRYSMNKDYDSILEATPTEYLSELLQAKDLKFATEMAIFASWDKRYEFSAFVNSRKELVHAIAPVIVLAVNRKTFHISDRSLNDYFTCVSECFGELTPDARRIIVAAYNQVKIDRPSIQDFDFNFVVHKVTDELRFEAARRFEMYMTGDKALADICAMIKNVESTNAELFHYMIAVLIDEMKNLDKHTEDDKEKVIQLLAELIKGDILKEEHRNCVFAFILSHVQCDFSLRMIDVLLNNLVSFTHFASLLLESDELAAKSPKLYKRLEKTVETFTFQEFLEFVPEIEMHPTVARFMNVNTPVPRKAKALMSSITEISQLATTISKNSEYQDWFASCLLSSFFANPTALDKIIHTIDDLPKDFAGIFLACCAHKMFKLIGSESFDSLSGEAERRKLYLLGKIVGMLTLQVNHPKFLKYFQIKKLLIYALSNGKLYGVVPFVCELLQHSTKHWNPPNPFTSGILSYLASIYVIPALKQSIRYHIESVFAYFKVKLDQMLLTEEVFPDKTADNFDFLVQPFNLSLLFSEHQIDRIVAYDQNLYFCFLASCVQSKTLPLATSAKMKILWALFGMIKERSQFLSEIIVSTAKNLELHSLAVVREFAKQTGAALVSQPVFFDYHDIMHSLLGNIVDGEFLESFITANSRWIHQFLGDVTAAVSLRRIQQDSVLDLQVNSTTGALANQLALLTMSAHQVATSTIGRHFRVDNGLYNHMLAVEEVCLRETRRGVRRLIDLPPSSMLHAAMHDVIRYDESTDLDTLESAMCTYFKCFEGSSNLLYTQSLAVMLDATFGNTSSAAKSALTGVCNSHLRDRLVVPLMLYHLISLGIANEADIDSIYSTVLNEVPCSDRKLDSIVLFLDYYLIQNSCFLPQQFIKTLSIVSFIPTNEGRCAKSIELLRKLYSEMSLVHKRKEVRTVFDPLKDLVQSVEYSSLFQKFKNAIRQQNEQQIVATSKQCSRSPREFFVVVLVKEAYIDIKNLLRCLNKVSENQHHLPNIFNAIIYLIEGYSTLPQFDFAKYYQVIRLLLRKCDCVALLHILRPLRCASFMFAWVELVTDSFLVSSLLQSNEGWKKYLPLLCDYTAAIGYLVDTLEPHVFRVCYRSYLRFILILCHDFPDFVASVAPKLVTLLPSAFLQLRNILLSVTPKGVTVISPLTPDLKIDHIPDVHQSCFQLCPTIVKSEIENSLVKVVTNAGDLDTLQVLIDCEPVLIPDLINRACELTFDPPDGQTQKIPFQHLPVYVIFYSVLLKAPEETAQLYIDGFLDQLRYPGRSTHFFAKLLIEIFKMNITRNDGISVSEMIVISIARRVALPPPHPWGLKVTVVELMGNKDIGFWDYPFVNQSDQTMMFLKSVYVAFCLHS